MPAIAPLPEDTRLLRPRRVKAAPVPASTSPFRRRILNYLLIFATVVLAMDGLAGDNGLLERMRASREYKTQMAALEAIRQENARMRRDIRLYRDDAAAIESLARKELGLIKPGELLFIVRDIKNVRY